MREEEKRREERRKKGGKGIKGGKDFYSPFGNYFQSRQGRREEM